MNGLAVSRCRSREQCRCPARPPPLRAEMVRPSARMPAGPAFDRGLGGLERRGGVLASLGQLGQPVLDRLQVGQDQLGVDRFDVARRVDRASTWITSSSWNTRTTWQMASVSRMEARNWLPRPSPCNAPGRARRCRRRSPSPGQPARRRRGPPEAPAGGRARPRRPRWARWWRRGSWPPAPRWVEGVEQGGLADVGQADDADRQGHRRGRLAARSPAAAASAFGSASGRAPVCEITSAAHRAAEARALHRAHPECVCPKSMPAAKRSPAPVVSSTWLTGCRWHLLGALGREHGRPLGPAS